MNLRSSKYKMYSPYKVRELKCWSIGYDVYRPEQQLYVSSLPLSLVLRGPFSRLYKMIENHGQIPHGTYIGRANPVNF